MGASEGSLVVRAALVGITLVDEILVGEIVGTSVSKIVGISVGKIVGSNDGKIVEVG